MLSPSGEMKSAIVVGGAIVVVVVVVVLPVVIEEGTVIETEIEEIGIEVDETSTGGVLPTVIVGEVRRHHFAISKTKSLHVMHA